MSSWGRTEEGLRSVPLLTGRGPPRPATGPKQRPSHGRGGRLATADPSLPSGKKQAPGTGAVRAPARPPGLRSCSAPGRAGDRAASHAGAVSEEGQSRPGHPPPPTAPPRGRRRPSLRAHTASGSQAGIRGGPGSSVTHKPCSQPGARGPGGPGGARGSCWSRGSRQAVLSRRASRAGVPPASLQTGAGTPSPSAVGASGPASSAHLRLLAKLLTILRSRRGNVPAHPCARLRTHVPTPGLISSSGPLLASNPLCNATGTPSSRRAASRVTPPRTCSAVPR